MWTQAGSLLCSIHQLPHTQLSNQEDFNFFTLKITVLLKTNNRKIIEHQPAFWWCCSLQWYWQVYTVRTHSCLLPQKKNCLLRMQLTWYLPLWTASSILAAQRGWSLPDLSQYNFFPLVLGALEWVEGGPGCFILCKVYKYCFHPSASPFLPWDPSMRVTRWN